jgi:hypothetical protein
MTFSHIKKRESYQSKLWNTNLINSDIPHIDTIRPTSTNNKVHNIKLIENEQEGHDREVKPRYENTNASAAFAIILVTTPLSSLAWNDRL